MLFIHFLVNLCTNISYKIKRINKATDTSPFEHIASVKNYKFYMQKHKESFEPVPFPQVVNKLMHSEELKIKKGDSLYLIKPFEYLKVIVNNKPQCLGIFDRLDFQQKNLVCYYKEDNVTSKVMFIFNENEMKIDKYFAGESSMFVFKVSGNFLGEKRDCRIIHYLLEDISLLEINQKEVENENSPPSFLEQLKMNLTDKYLTTDTEEKREEL